jgi:hypothetical protein
MGSNRWLRRLRRILTTPASVALTTTLQYYQLQIQQPLAAVSTLLGPGAGQCSDATVVANYQEEDGVLATVLFQRVYVSHSDRFVIFDPR